MYEAPPNDRSGGLAPLESVIYQIDVNALGTEAFATSLNVDAPGSSIKVKYYAEVDRGTTNCYSDPDARQQALSISPGQDETWYVLIANTNPNAGQSYVLDFRPDAPRVDIVEPASTTTISEHDPLYLRAVATGFTGASPSQVVTIWSYTNFAGTQITLGSTQADEALTVTSLCDGIYDVTAETVDAGSGASASDSVRVTVTQPTVPPTKCAPSVTIVRPDDNATFPVNASVTFQAVIDDDDDSTSEPIHPITWSANGLIINRDNLTFTREKWGTGNYTIDVDYGSASDSITIEFVETSNTAPTATITSPASGASLLWSDYFDGSSGVDIPVAGSATDAEDGSLPGSELEWEWRINGTSTWNVGPTGSSSTIYIPLTLIGASETFDVRLTATDSGSLSGQDLHVFTVIGPAN